MESFEARRTRYGQRALRRTGSTTRLAPDLARVTARTSLSIA